MAREDIREGEPERVRKKKPAPADDDDDRPRKKRPVDDDADEEEAPRKKKKIRKDEDEDEDQDEEGGDLGASPLSAIIPVGGSVFGLASMWLGIFALALSLVALGSFLEIITILPKIPFMLAAIMPIFWPLAILCGGLAFFTGKRKASYGAISGNLRAIFGILLGLVVMVLHAAIIYLHMKA